MIERVKSLLLALVVIVLYFVWPVDLIPLSILDDFVVAVLVAVIEVIKQFRMNPSIT